MKRSRKQNTNAGMTLLELIIAVSVFAIAATILLQAFVTSGRINRKSAVYLDASNAAQNLMEEVKSRDFSEVARAFNYPLDTVSDQMRLGIFKEQKSRYESGALTIKESLLQADSGVYQDVRLYRATDTDTSKVTASVISEDGGKTYTFNPRTKGANRSKYYFQIAGMESGEQTFDALLTFDGSESSGYSTADKNAYEVPNISQLDTKTNAFLIMPTNWDENAMKTIVEQQYQAALAAYAADPTPGTQKEEPQRLDENDVYTSTKRTLYVRVEESGGTIRAEARYTLNTYAYVKTGGSKYERMDICPCRGKADGKNGCFCTYESAYVPFYSSEADADLKNLFVFYYPNYNSTSASHPLDEIIFENTSNYPVNLYISKQQPENSQDATALSRNEQNYRMKLTVYENPSARGYTNWNTNPSLYRSQTILRTNLDTNISVSSTLNRTSVNQMQLTYQAMNDSGVAGKRVTGRGARQILAVNGLDDKESEDRIYAVTVGIYKAGAAKHNFPESDRIVLLDGAKDN